MDDTTSRPAASGPGRTPGGDSPNAFAVSAPALTLPKGGGAIRGLGEKFGANPVTGTGSMSVPIVTSPGRSGFGPQLALAYDSGAGNGPFGFGWSLSLPSITRKTDKGLPQYLDAIESDVFILSGAEDLVPEFEKDAAGQWILTAGKHTIHEKPRSLAGVPYTVRRYRPRIEGLFARIERWTNAATGDVHWRSISRDNVTTLYGKDNRSRIVDPADPATSAPLRVFSWLICASYDDKGNAILYEYAAENDEGVDRGLASERNRQRTPARYLKRIKYGNRIPNRDLATWQAKDPALLPADTWMFEVVFDYGEAHYREVALDPARPAEDQHRFVTASALTGLSWNSSSRHWTSRPDPFSSHRAGFEVRTHRRCQRVLMFHHIPDLPTGERGYEGLVRSTAFDYADLDYGHPIALDDELAHQGSSRFASFIRAVTQSGYVRTEPRPGTPEGSGYGTYLKKSLPPVEFEYSKALIQDRLLELDTESVENIPAGLDGSTYQWVDLDGEGLSGILTNQAGAWFYKPNLGEGEFGPLEQLASIPSLPLAGGGQQLLDLAGDGQLDVVSLSGPLPGFFERTKDAGWEPFRTFRQLPNIAWDRPNLRFVDLDGDGHADVLITEEDVFTWYPSLAEDGFGGARSVPQARDEERGPRLVLVEGTQSIYLADMCGDGLTDLVRIRNGEVCYWPNLGYGRFGPKVDMDNAPWFDHPDRFDHRRLRLTDIDGSGTSDLIYLGADGVRLYFNQSGNRFTGPRSLTEAPPVTDAATVMPADLRGNGTACLVWSSPLPADARRPVRYVDLMGGIKPHLLVASINNLGAETRIHYAPSTRFYLADKRNGRPWVTRLPFPVHVVERVETYDRINANVFVTRYAYHHGHFDGEEREFRGFAMVEQWDTEEFGTPPASVGPATDSVAAPWDVPSVHTKTWFHTGVHLGRDQISSFFAGLLDPRDPGEYYREPGRPPGEAGALLLPDTVLPPGLTVAEEREACRALKGSMVRREIYADDAPSGSPEPALRRASTPYTVLEQNFGIRVTQPRGANRHAVFFAHPRETITYHYERNTADPRIQHALTLESGPYGDPLRRVSIGYGRCDADASMPVPTDREKQTRTLITYNHNTVTTAIDDSVQYPDDYRTPLPADALTYELTGLKPESGATRFTFDEWVRNNFALLEQTTAIPFEQTADAVVKQKRPVEHLRTLYRPDDLGASQNRAVALLPLGVLQPLAIRGESFKLAFTAGLLGEIFQRSGQPLLPDLDHILGAQAPDPGGYIASQLLKSEGVFPATDPNDHWWIRSGRQFMSPNGADAAAAELTFAREHFFLPHRTRDAFYASDRNTETLITYDAYNLLMIESRDALGNRITVGERRTDGTINATEPGNDYRVLRPARVMDANRNRTRVLFDALGMVTGTALLGKPEQVVGDTLDSFRPDLTDAETLAHLANPLTLPHAILGRATSRFVYDLAAYQRSAGATSRQAPVVYTLARETHDADLQAQQLTKIQHSFAYSDGFGREIQTKMQAEPERPADGSPGNPRWVGSGWTIFNNKGKPVRQYQPFFSVTHRFELGVQAGVSSVLFYDPVERVVAVLHPNHTFEKVLFDPWSQTTWDVNDTVLKDPRADPDIGGYVARYFDRLSRTQPEPWQSWHARRQTGTLGPEEQAAATKAAAHADTPAVSYFDTLGRPFMTVADNGADPSHPGQHLRFATRTELDIEGNPRAVRDAMPDSHDPRGRIVMSYAYDMTGRRIHQRSIDAGARWMLDDASGRSIRVWDSRGHMFRTAYDQLRRPIRSFVTADHQSGGERLTGRLVYGERLAEAESRNLRGRQFLQLDQAGAVTNAAYDFKGNPLQSSRRIAKEYKDTIDWRAIDAALPSGPGAVLDATGFDAAVAALLEPEAYATHTSFDALNRPVVLTTPSTATVQPSLIRTGYNVANLLERIDVVVRGATASGGPQWTPFVTNIDYDARGLRQQIDYGNGASTVCRYDPDTFRLTQLLTRRSAAAFPADCASSASAGWPGCHVQDLHYVYDPRGNITHVNDRAQQAIYFRNRRVDPAASYTYDAIYRLIGASGREHLGQTGVPAWGGHEDGPRIGIDWSANDGAAMGTYTEQYAYDAAGNITEIRHVGSDPVHAGWKLRLTYNEPSQIETSVVGTPVAVGNRLSSTDFGSETAAPDRFLHDAHGNMSRMPHLRGAYPTLNMRWDYRDQLQQADLGEGTTAYYVYDAAGQRVRTIREKPGAVVEERIYLGALEIYRRRQGAARLERETLHIMDDKQRIALVETRTLDTAGLDAAPAQAVRYQVANHLGSSCLELDGQARIISYEEFTPYGNTSYQAVRGQTETPKRYRFTGKERDDDTGLYYHGARYLAPWLGRWIAVDPKLVDTSTTRSPSTTAGEERPTPIVQGGASDSSSDGSSADSIDVATYLKAYAYAQCNPTVNIDPDGKEPVPIGHIYTLRATVNGETVVYSGQTARELAQRLFKDKHKWTDIIKAQGTTIEAHAVSAELNVAASSRGTLASARKEALSAAEQVIVKRRRAEVGVKELNAIEAAEEANILKWGDRHAVRLGPRFTFRAGVKVGAFGAFALLDVFMMYRDQKISQYQMATYVLEDEKGVFALQEHDRGIFRQNHYFKNYKTGPLAGQSVQISEDEFYELKEEAELLWGRVDWKGDWVPGLLRRDLPVIDVTDVCHNSAKCA